MKPIINHKTTLMTSVKLLAVVVCLCFSVATHATVITYPQVPGVQACQFAYTLKARDHGTTTWNTVYLYNTPVTTASGGATNTTCGYLSCSGSTDYKIIFSTTVTSAAVYPAPMNVTPTFGGDSIMFTVSGPKKFYVDINGDHYNNCIHIIADPLEVNPPQQGAANVIFIPSGTFVDSIIKVPSGKTLYIQGGAGVRSINLDSTTNTKVLGRGVIFRPNFDAISASYASNVTIDGVLDFNHGWGGGGGCGIRCGQSSNVSISNCVSFSSKTWGDGYDIFCSNGVTVNDVFIRTNDDAIAFYGGGKDGFTGNCTNITVTNSTLLPDLAHSFHVGVYGDQNTDTQIRNITVANVDICDWSRTAGQGSIYFTVGDRVRAANFKFSNVRVKDFVNTAFITMAVVYNSTYNYNPGRAIDSVFYTNVSYTGTATPASSINGYDATRETTNVFFKNLLINGTTVTSAAAGNFTIGTYTSNITFSALPLTIGQTYVLTAENSGQCANPSGGSSANATDIVQNTYANNTYQQWVLVDAGNNLYKLKNVNNGLYMDINNASTVAGTNAIQWPSDAGLNQQFALIPQPGGYYSIMACHSGQVLDVNGNSSTAGATIIQWPYSGNNNQCWLFGSPGTTAATVAAAMVEPSLAIIAEPVVNSALSPNGDGVNDVLTIANIQNYPDNKIMVINVNGTKVYEASHYDNVTQVFNGHSSVNGQLQPQGTYYYQLQYTDKGVLKSKTGFIVLKY
ncbi:RICIN domain-containing protein [Mucilaginibacter sp. L196]|uniref:RICIN domain-containing protein n=1 Tax=Mucilaginibacter sp. L196 TaxID=1641870 RepID=UPI00131C4F4F|nr:RICIN domain-containing protein [Mucilaginibacter sp. L196]